MTTRDTPPWAALVSSTSGPRPSSDPLRAPGWSRVGRQEGARRAPQQSAPGSRSPPRSRPHHRRGAVGDRCRPRLRPGQHRAGAELCRAHPPLARGRAARRPRRRRTDAGHLAHRPPGRLPAGRRPPRRLPLARRQRRACPRFDLHAPRVPHQLRPRGQTVPLSVPRRRLRRRWPRRGRAAAGAAAPPECHGSKTAASSSRSERPPCGPPCSTGSTPAPATGRCAPARSTSGCRTAPAGRSPPAASWRCSRRAVRHRRRAGDVLRAVAVAGLRQRALPDAQLPLGWMMRALHVLGRQLPGRRRRRAHAARVLVSAPTRRRARSRGSPAW